LDELGVLRNQYYSVNEIAELVGRSPYTIRRWLREGRLKGARVTGQLSGGGDGLRVPYLIPREEIVKLRSEGRMRSASEGTGEAGVPALEATEQQELR